MYSTDCRSMNPCYLSLSVELPRKLYAILLLDIVCAAPLTVKRNPGLTSSLLCKDSFNGFARGSTTTCIRKGPSCVLVLISVQSYANCHR